MRPSLPIAAPEHIQNQTQNGRQWLNRLSHFMWPNKIAMQRKICILWSTCPLAFTYETRQLKNRGNMKQQPSQLSSIVFLKSNNRSWTTWRELAKAARTASLGIISKYVGPVGQNAAPHKGPEKILRSVKVAESMSQRDTSLDVYAQNCLNWWSQTSQTLCSLCMTTLCSSILPDWG